VWPRPRRSTCLDLRNTGWPGVTYCEANAINRLDPQVRVGASRRFAARKLSSTTDAQNIILQPSDPRTNKYDAFKLDRPPAAKSALPALRPSQPPLPGSF